MRRDRTALYVAACSVAALMLAALYVGGRGGGPSASAPADAAPPASSARGTAASETTAPAVDVSTAEASSTSASSADVPDRDPAEVAVADLRRLLDTHLETHPGAIVAGVVLPDGRRQTITAGRSGTLRPLDPSSVFELGGITKAYTGTLLADMVLRGEVALDDPVTRYLPAHVRLPSAGGRPITLADLATHTSGLQSNPTVIRSPDPARPLAELTDLDRLYAMVSGYRMPSGAAREPRYSNAGFGLLGTALARRAGTSYERLLRERVLAPARARPNRYRPGLGRRCGGRPGP